jgi:hypothetical protein
MYKDEIDEKIRGFIEAPSRDPSAAAAGVSVAFPAAVAVPVTVPASAAPGSNAPSAVVVAAPPVFAADEKASSNSGWKKVAGVAALGVVGLAAAAVLARNAASDGPNRSSE